MNRQAWALRLRSWWRLILLPTGATPTPVSIGIALSLLTGLEALLRGLDLALLSPPPQPLAPVPGGDGALRPTINYALDYLGHNTWGYLFIGAATLLLLVTAFRRIIPLLFAHALLSGVYIGFAIVLVQGLLEQGTISGLRFVAAAVAGCGYSVMRILLLISDLRNREYEE